MKKRHSLALAMGLAIIGVSALAMWDENRESAAALKEFAQEQSVLAQSVANTLRARLGARDPALPPSAKELPTLTEGMRQLERPDALRFFFRLPGEPVFRDSSGASVLPSPQAFAGPGAVLRIPGDAAALLGLPHRTAMVGLADFDAGNHAQWRVAVVASAERERNRDRRAGWRLALTISLVVGLVAAFGGVALREQRNELELARKLEVAELTREGEDRLGRLSQAATTLTLASGMAHELGTPLAVIVGRAEQLVSRVTGDARAEKALSTILEQADHIHQVVRGFLELARGGNPRFERVDPTQILRSAAALVEHRFAQAGVLLRVEAGAGLPLLVCDVRLLEHALVNLLLNACDASPPGAEVVVRAETATEGLALEVIDEGAGIPDSQAARVMEPFFTTKPVEKGTGLGLAVANEIARSHHGTLALSPNRPQGTRAVLTLPWGEAHAGA